VVAACRRRRAIDHRAIIAKPVATPGGWMALIGGLLVIGAATIGFPRDEG